MLFGGVERVRTSAPRKRPNCLANNPLHHLGTTPFLTTLFESSNSLYSSLFYKKNEL